MSKPEIINLEPNYEGICQVLDRLIKLYETAEDKKRIEDLIYSFLISSQSSIVNLNSNI